MSKKQLFYRNQISIKYLDKKYLSNLSKKFNNIFPNIVNEINNPKKTLNILSKNFEFNFSFKDLKQFKKSFFKKRKYILFYYCNNYFFFS